MKGEGGTQAIFSSVSFECHGSIWLDIFVSMDVHQVTQIAASKHVN